MAGIIIGAIVGSEVCLTFWSADLLRERGGLGPAAAAASRPAPPVVSPAWTRPQDPLVVGRFVLDGILNNDLFIVLQPEYRQGVEARCNALLESMVGFTPTPESVQEGIKAERFLRTPVFAQEIAHRKATRKRTIPNT